MVVVVQEWFTLEDLELDASQTPEAQNHEG
jgi:hypothetical protein